MLRRVFRIANSQSALSGVRSMASSTFLQYDKFGDPCDVLYLKQQEVDEPKPDEVLVKILAAPINPADINTIQGKYPVKPKFPAVGGNECVAEIVTVGCNVKNLKAGDRVVPFATGLGTWRSFANFNGNDLMKVSSNIGIAEAATITVNPCTAYRMLKDFVDLKPGDTVIQNGANSAVGQAVHQLCAAWGINSVGVVRDRPEIDNLRKYLMDLGATEILTEEQIRTTKIFDLQLKKPILAFNCVGGKSATAVAQHLDHKGFMITYGGMSREPVTAGTAALIFKDITFKGFWMTRWTKENSTSTQRSEMLNKLCEMIENGAFKGPMHEMVPIDKFANAVAQAVNFKGFTGKKFILDMRIN